jgi:hypothetical protein
MKPLAAQYDQAADQWIVDVPFALPGAAVRAAMGFVEKVNRQRFSALSAGDRKDMLTRGLAALKAGRWVQRIAKKGDHLIFAAPYAPTKTISFPTHGAV